MFMKLMDQGFGREYHVSKVIPCYLKSFNNNYYCPKDLLCGCPQRIDVSGVRSCVRPSVCHAHFGSRSGPANADFKGM